MPSGGSGGACNDSMASFFTFTRSIDDRSKDRINKQIRFYCQMFKLREICSKSIKDRKPEGTREKGMGNEKERVDGKKERREQRSKRECIIIVVK